MLVAAAALFSVATDAATSPLPIRVVVVTTFEIGEDTGDKPGEFQAWVERFPLPQTIPFPAGFRSLRYDPQSHVLGLVIGEGKAHAAASIMALGLDPRFDLTHAYWILAGIAGIDPAQGSVGSAAWAHYAVDGDLGYEIDGREIPPDWPTGITPDHRATPYEEPVPANFATQPNPVFHLNEALADWAFARTKDLALPDDANLQKVRVAYADQPNAMRPPFVLIGDTLSADRFWVGERMTEWSRRWIPYWTGGKGISVTSAEEDTGFLQALTFLAAAGKADYARAAVLRTASDYTAPPPGISAASFLASEAHGALSGYREALDSAYLVGSPVVRELCDHWDRYATAIPSAAGERH